ncbi:hypothetical protein [Candidatus Enterovibrio escicola]|uniref:hypothetical protein n=1 Tax=Candidatus Enterovibrio escicola TaxID=1927127 RepID=UPI0016813D34|nr:hypothetical protein [Candidatus Enterovibrio escacola]
MSYGKCGFALQFMLDITRSDADKYPLRLSDLIVSNIAREKGPTSYDWCNDPAKRITDLQVLGLANNHYLPLPVLGRDRERVHRTFTEHRPFRTR